MAKPKKVLVLRTCSAEMKGYGGFVWPESGHVKAPDWKPAPICGYGLHGLLWGVGNGDLLSWADNAKWLVVEVLAAGIVEINGKVKFESGEVIYCGERGGAVDLLIARGAAKHGAVTAGTATAGQRGTATAGQRGTATAGYAGTATAGDAGTATAGDAGTATAGYDGTATAGYAGTATAGQRGTATAGDAGTATAGFAGTATAGDAGTATAGYAGTLVFRYWDPVASRSRMRVGYVGEDGIQPGVKYKLSESNNIVPA